MHRTPYELRTRVIKKPVKDQYTLHSSDLKSKHDGWNLRLPDIAQASPRPAKQVHFDTNLAQSNAQTRSTGLLGTQLSNSSRNSVSGNIATLGFNSNLISAPNSSRQNAYLMRWVDDNIG